MGSQWPIRMVGDNFLDSTGMVTNMATSQAEREYVEKTLVIDGKDIYPSRVTATEVTGDLIRATNEMVTPEITADTIVRSPVYLLSSPRWEDLRSPATATKLGGSNDPTFGKLKDNGAGSQGAFCYLFSSTVDQELYLILQMPHAWVAASAIEPHVHWCPTTTDSGNVIWGLEYTIAKVGGTFGSTNITYNSAQAAGGTAYVHKLADLGSISMAGMEVSSVMVCRLFRYASSGSDTYGANAAMLEFDFHFKIDTPGGSDLETSKTTVT